MVDKLAGTWFAVPYQNSNSPYRLFYIYLHASYENLMIGPSRQYPTVFILLGSLATFLQQMQQWHQLDMFPSVRIPSDTLLVSFLAIHCPSTNIYSSVCFLCPLDIVPTVYARKPQVISRYVLPLLWNLLNTSNGSAGAGNSALKTSTSRLTTTLYSCMGRALTEQASGQVPRIQDKIHEIIGSWHSTEVRVILEGVSDRPRNTSLCTNELLSSFSLVSRVSISWITRLKTLRISDYCS